MGIKEFAIKTGKPEKTIHAVLNGSSNITAEMAILFEQVLKAPANIWLRIQKEYEEYHARLSYEESKKDSYEWAKAFPYTDLVTKGFVESASTIEAKAQNLFQFFNIATVKSWEDLYINQGLKVQFRTSLQYTHEQHSVSAWLRKGEIDAKSMDVSAYNEAKFKLALHSCRQIMVDKPTSFFKELQTVCASAGVKVVFTRSIKKAPITGAARWVGAHPLIQLSAYKKKYDGFWFSFFHEAAHILLHDKRDVFLEDVKYTELDQLKENEANEFALNWVCPKEPFKAFVKQGDYSDNAIIDFAQKVKTHPCHVVAQLRRIEDSGFTYSMKHPFDETIEFNELE